MAVDLGDLIESLRVNVNPPGQDLFAATGDDEWTTRLEGAFWNARLDGLFVNYTASDGIITPINGTVDIPRDQQQLIILYAALDVVVAEMRNLQSSFKATAGPVEYETQRSATLLKAVLDTLRGRIKDVVNLLSVYYMKDVSFDAVIARTDSMWWGDSWWVR